ncbi:MAG: hypothetical protein HY078_16405 [Elusimicrobia bacterium]|nr:hypothetical protein [Elusimicrobiota bacterium]
MPTTKSTSSAHAKIIVGLPNLQEQIGLVNRVINSASAPDLERWEDIGQLLCDLYSQLQHQKQVTVYRVGHRGRAKLRAED